jgi:hypothetical protein
MHCASVMARSVRRYTALGLVVQAWKGLVQSGQLSGYVEFCAYAFHHQRVHFRFQELSSKISKLIGKLSLNQKQQLPPFQNR